MQEVNNSNFMQKLFIEEVKPALEWFDARWGASIIPEEYTKVTYVQNASSTWFNTGVYCGDNIDLYVRVKCPSASGSFYILQSRDGSGGRIHGISGSATGATITANCSGVSLTSAIKREADHQYDISMSIKDGMMRLYVKDITTGEYDTQVAVIEDAVDPSNTIGLFGNGFNSLSSGYQVERAKIVKDGSTVADYIPARKDADDGIFDLVTKTFMMPASGNAISGPDL